MKNLNRLDIPLGLKLRNVKNTNKFNKKQKGGCKKFIVDENNFLHKKKDKIEINTLNLDNY